MELSQYLDSCSVDNSFLEAADLDNRWLVARDSI